MKDDGLKWANKKIEDIKNALIDKGIITEFVGNFQINYYKNGVSNINIEFSVKREDSERLMS